MSGGGGKTEKQTTIQSTDPWAPTQPGLKKGIAAATNLFDKGGLSFDPYPGDWVAPISGETTKSWDMISNRATAGSPLLKSAQNYNQAILDGDFTALDPMISKVRDTVNSNYSLGGRFGSGAHDRAITEGVGGLISGAQQQAAQFAPTLAEADYMDPKMLSLIGTQRENAAQDMIDAERSKWAMEEEEPLNEIQRLIELLSGSWGGTALSQAPVQKSSTSPWMQGLGAGMTGLSALASMW